jgi:hypothetical protein
VNSGTIPKGYKPDVGTIYCIDLFESALNSNRKVKVVHETDTPHAFDVT